MISPRPDAAVYQQLAQILRDRIREGVYQPGQTIPSEPHLVQEFGIARETVRRAVRELRIQGLLIVERGRGTRVVDRPESATVKLMRGSSLVVRMPTPADIAEFGVPQGIPIVVIMYGANPVQVVSSDGKTFFVN